MEVPTFDRRRLALVFAVLSIACDTGGSGRLGYMWMWVLFGLRYSKDKEEHSEDKTRVLKKRRGGSRRVTGDLHLYVPSSSCNTDGLVYGVVTLYRFVSSMWNSMLLQFGTVRAQEQSRGG